MAACLRDSHLPPTDFVARYLPGLFSASVAHDVRDELAVIMADFHPPGCRMMATELARADTRDLLPTIRVPTLLVWGDEDARSPLSVAHQFRAAVPAARLSIISGAGHVSKLERPAEFDAAVRAFGRSSR